MNVGVAFFLAVALITLPDDNSNESDNRDTIQEKNRGRRTFGGKQFWTDFLVLHQWRIQQHAVTKHFRLLNPNDRAIVSGSFEKCKERFEETKTNSNFPDIGSHVLVTIHGLGRSRSSMDAIGSFIRDKNDYTWVNFGYASTRNDIESHASALRSVLNHLAAAAKANSDGDKGVEVHFVGHSFGNIVVRFLIGDIQRDETQPAWKIGRMVMLAPPNNGSAMASLLKKSKTFNVVAGKSGMNLAVEWAAIQQQLATPSAEFGIIAGGRGNHRGFNPWLKGDDDLIVSVEETKLKGATDFLVVPSIHTYIMNKEVVTKATSQFLKKGHFFSVEKRNPIEK